MKKILINWVLPPIYDALIGVLVALSKKSESAVDDTVVNAIVKDRDMILEAIKESF